MFTVKATYRQETRKIKFTDDSFFPSYDRLYYQLYRVFPISQNFPLSKLLFSPDATKPAQRVLLAKEVRSAEDYQRAIASFHGRAVSGALLKFTVFDDIPHASTPIRYPSFAQGEPDPTHGAKVNTNTNWTPALLVPPPPIIMSHTSRPIHFGSDSRQYTTVSSRESTPTQRQPVTQTCTPSLNPFLSMESGSAQSGVSQQKQEEDTTLPTSSSCCSVSQKKADIEILLTTFKADLERIMDETFKTTQSASPTVPAVPGAWPEPAPSTHAGTMGVPMETSSEGSGTHICRSMWCVACGKLFNGSFYNCNKCSWHVLCTSCFSEHGSGHGRAFGEGHVLAKHTCYGCIPVAAPPRPVTPPVERRATPAQATPVIHGNIICDNCVMTIVGVRHKCLDCPNYDLCTSCIGSGSAEAHNPFHEFFEIEEPGHVSSDNGERNTASRNGRQGGITLHDDAAPATAGPVMHNAACDLCDSRIRGDRYKCISCPDFDTCSSCFTITNEQHPGHGFVKVANTGDLMLRNSLSSDVRHYADCDSCNKTIYGVRYKCLHPGCPDFDLCASCEAHPIAVHPLAHPMLKMKTSDTVVPTVYRVGQTNIIPCRETSMPSPAPPVDNEKQETVLSSTQGLNVRKEMPSLASSATGSTVPALGLDACSDTFHESWAKVNKEFKAQMLDPDAHKVTQAAITKATPTDSADTPMTMMNPFQDPEPKSMPDAPAEVLPEAAEVLNEAPAEVLLASVQPVVENPEMSQHSTIPVSTLNQSLATLLDGYKPPSTTVPSPCSTSINSIIDFTTETPSPRVNDVSSRLEATFVMDTTVPDGQIFPPGAEFVKSWRMMNNGNVDWPETTELHYVSGEKFSLDLHSGSSAVRVGAVTAGTEVQVWSAELKAPDTPGTYRSYWRLTDGNGNDFGHTLWVEITVADSTHLSDGSGGSLASSSVIMMPQGAASTHLAIVSDVAALARRLALNQSSSRTATSKPSIDITMSGNSSPDSSISLISLPVSSEDDDWEDSRSHNISQPQSPREVTAAEYVVLYETSSDEE